MPSSHPARWLLLASAAFTLGFGMTHVATHRPHPTPSALAAPAPALAALTVPRPPGQDGEVRLHPTTTPRPSPQTRVVVVPVPTPAPRPRRRPQVTRTRHIASTTFEQQLRRTVAQIPFYRPGLAQWVVRPGLANYGLTDRVTRTVYISPRVPRRLLYSVVVHEWGHVVSASGYADLRTADAAVMRWYGVSSPARAIEIAADCVARTLGATWTHYTACDDSHWRYGARYLMVGWQLPEQAATTG